MDEPLPGASDADDESLYDAYLDATLEGRAEDPDVFLARHPHAGPALRRRIDALHGVVRPGSVRPGSVRPGDAQQAAPPPAAAEPGLPYERLGDFRLLRRLDEGGMGTVYVAEQESLGRVVALKVVRPDLRDSPTAAERFRREALAVAKLRHRNIVTVHAVGEEGGVRYLAMELVEGRGLDEVIADAAARGARIPVADVARWGARLARALACAHAAGIVHRDVKPSNVRIAADGEPMLLDFGIALGAEGPALTQTGPFVGSPVYAAPEQITGEPDAIDARTDVYALGVTLHECLAGRLPWSGATVERAFRRILTEDLPDLRRVHPGVPRDLEVVVAKSVEKEPARRYANAAEFAEDLEAVLAFRPIRARPPGRAARLVKWARRNPGPAVAAGSAVVAAALLAGTLVVRERWDAERARADAQAAVAQARSLLAGYRERRADSADLEQQVDTLHELLWTQFLTPEQDALLDEREDDVARLRRDREAVFYEVLDLLRRAERLDPAAPGAAETRAELYLDRWREATDARDPSAAAFYRERVAASDPGGTVLAQTRGGGTFAVTSDPPGAEVHLFRYRELADLVPHGAHRLVPVPLGGPAPQPFPGTVALEVTEPRDGLARGDLVLALDGRAVGDLAPADARAIASRGGARGRVHHAGRVEERALPAALRVRVTAAPLALSDASRAGTTPLAPLPLEPGAYLALLRRDGSEDVRIAFAVRRRGDVVRDVRMFPEGTTPEGFVRVPCDYRGDGATFWIEEREVTAGEYLAFLDDPATRAEIAASPRPVRVPRGFGGSWPRNADGTYALPADWSPDWPALGVSYEDAQAYARWATLRAHAAGRDVEFAIPTFDEWLAAGLGAGDRFYVFGNRFRPKWVKSCYAQAQANPEPVLSYPIDESAYGVFDMTGGAQEWCASWYDEARGLRRLAGGAWGEAKPELFKVWGGSGALPASAGGQTSFRLVVRTPPGARR